MYFPAALLVLVAIAATNVNIALEPRGSSQAPGDAKAVEVGVLNRSPEAHLAGKSCLLRVSLKVDQEATSDDGAPLYFLTIVDPAARMQVGGVGSAVFACTKSPRIAQSVRAVSQKINQNARVTFTVKKLQNEYMPEPQYEVEVVRVEWLGENGRVTETVE